MSFSNISRKTRFLVAGALLTGASLVVTTAFGQHGDPHANPHAAAPTEHGVPGEHGAPDEHGAPGEHASGEHGAPGEHAEGHGHGPAPINWTDLSDKSRPAFIALLVNFGLLAGLYYTLAKKPVAEGLKQRRINIGKDIDDARKMLEEAKERAKKYQGDLKNADEDAATAKAALVSAGKGEVERLLSDTDERSERMKRDAERLVEQERKQLQNDLLIETIDAAVVQAHKVLEKSATHEDHARLANELLAELAKKPAAPNRVAPAARVGGAS